MRRAFAIPRSAGDALQLAHNADDRALMKRFQLFGPPGIILFDASGKEVPQGRVIGFMPPDSFIRQLQRVAS